MAAIWYFSLICCPAHTDSHRDFILLVPLYLLFTFIHKRNNATVAFFLQFMSIFLKSIYSFISKPFNPLPFRTCAPNGAPATNFQLYD